MIALVAGGGFEPPTFGLRGEIHPVHRTTPANQVQRNTEKSRPAVGSLWAALAAEHGQNTDRTRTEHGRNTARPVAEQSRSCGWHHWFEADRAPPSPRRLAVSGRITEEV